MSTQRASTNKAVAEEPDAEQVEAVADQEIPGEGAAEDQAAPDDSPSTNTCADCGSTEVVVKTGAGAAQRGYCATDAPVNVSDR